MTKIAMAIMVLTFFEAADSLSAGRGFKSFCAHQ